MKSKWIAASALLVLAAAVGSSSDSRAAVEPRLGRTQEKHLAGELNHLRGRVLDVEQSLLDGLKSEQKTEANMKKVQLLIRLQREERALGQRRLAELQSTVDELESRRSHLLQTISSQELEIRRSLMAIQHSSDQPATENLIEQEKLEAPRRKALANLVDRGLKDVEALRIDLEDADTLEARIQDERQQLTYVFHDLDEQQGMLEFNRQLQADILKKNHKERLSQLENYRNLKNAEAQVESLITDFNARIELERVQENEREANSSSSHSGSSQGVFAASKGKLALPVAGGKVLSAFGRAYDVTSRLYVFKKGIDIGGEKKQPVIAVSAGKVAFSGELPGYGRVAIIDHGDHFYSLCAHLGDLSRKPGDVVAAGETIGVTDDQGTPVYFEIRARNVPVNPLQWVSN